MLIPYFFSILLLLFTKIKFEVAQLHFVYFPVQFHKDNPYFHKVGWQLQKEVGATFFLTFSKPSSKILKM
jgi:hypothetical protein